MVVSSAHNLGDLGHARVSKGGAEIELCIRVRVVSRCRSTSHTCIDVDDLHLRSDFKTIFSRHRPQIDQAQSSCPSSTKLRYPA